MKQEKLKRNQKIQKQRVLAIREQLNELEMKKQEKPKGDETENTKPKYFSQRNSFSEVKSPTEKEEKKQERQRNWKEFLERNFKETINSTLYGRMELKEYKHKSHPSSKLLVGSNHKAQAGSYDHDPGERKRIYTEEAQKEMEFLRLGINNAAKHKAKETFKEFYSQGPKDMSQHQARATSQSAQKGSEGKTQLRKFKTSDKDILKKAALCIQCAFRKMKARKQVKALKLKKSKETKFESTKLKKDSSLLDLRHSKITIRFQNEIQPKIGYAKGLRRDSVASTTSIKEKTKKVTMMQIPDPNSPRSQRKKTIPMIRIAKAPSDNKRSMMLKNKQLLELAKTNNMRRISSLGFHYSDEDVNVTDKTGNTPLHYAAKNGNLEMAKWLAEKGADPNSVGANGNTPMHMAALSQNPHVNILSCRFRIKRKSRS